MRRLESVIVLTGGRSKRFGSDKYLARLSGLSLLENILQQLPEGIEIFLVGDEPENSSRKLTVLREFPIHGGPVAAIASALPYIQSEWVGVIATDMPLAAKLFPKLLANIDESVGVSLPQDAAGFLQPLIGVYSVAKLSAAIADLGSVENQSMKAILALLNVKSIKLSADELTALIDIDTEEDLLAVRKLVGEKNG